MAKKVKGGSIIVGESSIISPPDINARLLDSAKRLGNSIESAMDPSSRDPNASVDFAVLGDDGILLDDYGGIPLKAKENRSIVCRTRLSRHRIKHGISCP